MGEAKSRKLDKQRKNGSRQMQYERKEHILANILLYTITAALTCASFCSTPHLLIYPPPTLFCCLKIFISLSIPPLTSVFLSPKFLFIIGNLIVLFLFGSFNTVAGNCNHRDQCGNHYRSSTFTGLHNSETEERDVDQSDQGGERTEEEETVELNKRAADFIARVNYQIRFEKRKEEILANILLYTETAALTCASFCSTPHLLIYPPPTLICCLKIFISPSIPPLTSVFLILKFLFIIGNLIVLFLVGSFNTVAGDFNHRDPCGNHYRSSTFTDLHNSETEERDVNHSDHGGERTEEEEETVELNKRAADFIYNQVIFEYNQNQIVLEFDSNENRKLNKSMA